LGAVWASRAQYYTSQGVSYGTPELAGLSDALLVSVGLFFAAACLAGWALYKETSTRKKLARMDINSGGVDTSA